jgi:anti-anti-sigma factor
MLEPSPTSFAISIEGMPGWTVLALSGELDLATAPILADSLGELEGSIFAVAADLTGLTFLDSSGIALLLKARPGGERLTLICPPEGIVARVLGIVKAASVLHIIPSVEDLIASPPLPQRALA